MTALEAFGFWWVETILPWAIDSTLMALLLVVLAVLARNATPSFRKAVATLGLAKMAIPPILLPIGLFSLGVANPAGSSPAPLGAPLAGPVAGVLGAVHLLGVAVGLVLVARRARELHRLLRSARPITQPAVLETFAELTKSLGLRRTPRLVASSLADVPFATGLRTPTVVLPRLLNAEPDALDFGEPQLNGLGYFALQNDRPEDAVALFELNAQRFPESANVWDSLGDGLVAIGATDRARESYERAIEIDPNAENSREKLDGLSAHHDD